MKRFFEFFARYTGFWVVLFMIMRIMFILFNGKIASELPYQELLKSFLYGLRLDLSMAGYLTIIPLVVWLIHGFTGGKWADVFIKFYHILIIIFILTLCLIDAELYQYWQHKVDAYALSFSKFPKEMMSFSSGISWGKLIFFVTLFSFLVKMAYDNIMVKLSAVQTMWGIAGRLGGFVGLAAVLFLMIRGSLGMAAMNQSFVYYSNIPFCNHAALNTTWNFLSSLLQQNSDNKHNPYSFISDEAASKIYMEAVTPKLQTQPLALTAVQYPNILFIVLEGWSAATTELTGGDASITPSFTSIAKNGLSFSQFYANGNRTDKGLAAIFCGEPASAKSSIINNLHKFTNIAAIPQMFLSKQYHTEFVYGGESEFANMKAFWLSTGFKKITDVHSFDQAIIPENWGVHDNELYAKLINSLSVAKPPFFAAALTLSSHEPFNVPHNSSFTGNDEAAKYKNAVHYSDECLGNFLVQATTQPWYKNTLIFILSDHGHEQPNQTKPYLPKKFHIPCVITGGALNPNLKGVKINQVFQQTDISKSLAETFQFDSRSFTWSNNMFDTLNYSFATYTFDDGVGIVDRSGFVSFDQISKKIILTNSLDSAALTQLARAKQQLYYSHYLER
ncbi:MAG: sulfatase-like hydrolase/transferase [Bacteroidia bacterium]|nr:sulfatase-like hydrolase/transferase [Bacteroidia bacterium]